MLLIAVVSIALTSCGDDDEPVNPSAYNDYSVLWTVVDRGDYTVQEANVLAAGFSQDDAQLFAHVHEEDALESFTDYCQELRYYFNKESYKNITLCATLTRDDDLKALKSYTFYITPDGTTLK